MKFDGALCRTDPSGTVRRPSVQNAATPTLFSSHQNFKGPYLCQHDETTLFGSRPLRSINCALAATRARHRDAAGAARRGCSRISLISASNRGSLIRRLGCLVVTTSSKAYGLYLGCSRAPIKRLIGSWIKDGRKWLFFFVRVVQQLVRAGYPKLGPKGRSRLRSSIIKIAFAKIPLRASQLSEQVSN